ncbi:hypothetical protein GY45DRAFT_721301 [Cubamyces sp. BRFM 1775]|nr:hypothetical protein GY45DRAFT_721301 [Cubamyces sp. BRFM 1775]
MIPPSSAAHEGGDGDAPHLVAEAKYAAARLVFAPARPWTCAIIRFKIHERIRYALHLCGTGFPNICRLRNVLFGAAPCSAASSRSYACATPVTCQAGKMKVHILPMRPTDRHCSLALVPYILRPAVTATKRDINLLSSPGFWVPAQTDRRGKQGCRRAAGGSVGAWVDRWVDVGRVAQYQHYDHRGPSTIRDRFYHDVLPLPSPKRANAGRGGDRELGL